jgi:hypothetical protein
MTGVVIEEFKAVARNSLRGFTRVRMPSGMIFHDVGIYETVGTRWASPASKPMLGRDGTQLQRDGKQAYSPMASFVSKEMRDKFSSSIIAAIEASHPEAFAPPADQTGPLA